MVTTRVKNLTILIDLGRCWDKILKWHLLRNLTLTNNCGISLNLHIKYKVTNYFETWVKGLEIVDVCLKNFPWHPGPNYNSYTVYDSDVNFNRTKICPLPGKIHFCFIVYTSPWVKVGRATRSRKKLLMIQGQSKDWTLKKKKVIVLYISEIQTIIAFKQQYRVFLLCSLLFWQLWNLRAKAKNEVFRLFLPKFSFY